MSDQAIAGDDVRVNAHTIEKRLADIWRDERGDDEQDENQAVTRAALWNVVAHTWTSEQHAFATETLGRASASVPQRTIVVRADPNVDRHGGAGEMTSYISTNCHMIGGGRQVCSEEVSIVASGERVAHVPPLVASLLLPDMPVAVWWLGDLPNERPSYVDTLLDPADRLIVDSSQFDSAEDFALVFRIADKTTTAPADLNWARVEEWRSATAAMFDPPGMRERMRAIAKVRVISGGAAKIGPLSEAVLFVSWLTAQLGYEVAFEFVSEGKGEGILSVELQFGDGSTAVVRGDRERRVVVGNCGDELALDCVTRALGRGIDDLIVRLLKNPQADRVYVKTLGIAHDVARRVA
ncbi:MAG TPA: glucose-6-phosphate dehydrogenase assembly protein OpcA [Thermoanaerobaculia bacterium]